MRPRGEELGDAGGVEPMLREPNRGPEPRASSSNHDRIVGVIHHRVGRGGGEAPGRGGGGGLGLPEAPRHAAAPHLADRGGPWRARAC